MSYILENQRLRNNSTASHWDLYAGHRKQVMTLVNQVLRITSTAKGGMPPGIINSAHSTDPALASGKSDRMRAKIPAFAGKMDDGTASDLQHALHHEGNGRLCILGAGNCNDVDLTLLTKWFGDVHLVDWDAPSLRKGIEKQQVSPASVTLHTGIELTGVAGLIERWNQTTPSHDEISQVIALLSEPHDIGLHGAFDVVVSSSLLTQLLELPVALLGLNHPRTADVALNIRAAHFRLMMSLLAPGGTGVMVTELISSDTCTALGHCPENNLPALFARLIRDKQFFIGTNPHALLPALLADPAIAPRIAHTRLTDPWRWHIGPGRSFLAYGFVFKTT